MNNSAVNTWAGLLGVLWLVLFPLFVLPSYDVQDRTADMVVEDAGTYYDLADGRRVVCISHGEAISCDWDHATVNIGSSEDNE